MKKCPNGHFVGDNVKFCPKCGAPIGQPPMIPLPKTNANHGNLSKKTIAIFVVAGIAVLSVLFAILGGAAWYFYGYQQDKYSLEGLAKASVNYDYIDNFHEGLARVVKGSKYGFIDKMGNEVIPCDFDVIEEEDVDYDFHDGFALVHKGEKAYYINKEGQKAFQLNNYDNLSAFSNGYAAVYKNGKLGYIDTKGNEVIACSLNGYGYGFSEGLAAVMKGDKVGYIDTKGKVVVPFQYEIIDLGEPGQFAEGLAAVCKNERFGYIDKSGNEVVPCKYSIAFDFRDGRALVRKDDKYGYIDKSGKEVIPCSFDEAEFFSEGFAAVSKDGKYYVIDKNGKEVFSLSAYDTGFGSPIFEEGLAPVFRKIGDSHVCGFVDTSGKEVIPCVYTNWPSFSEGLAVVEKDGVYGFVDKKGNNTFDIENEEIRKALQTRIQKEKTKRMHEEEEEQREINRQFIESTPYTSTDSDVSTYNSNVDVRPILLECQNEITTCQREIESLCRTFAALASDNDIDVMKYGQMKITFINGVNGWLDNANKAFDKCARDLQQAGVNDAVSAVNQEKRQFNRAINELKSRTLQQVEMVY